MFTFQILVSTVLCCALMCFRVDIFIWMKNIWTEIILVVRASRPKNKARLLVLYTFIQKSLIFMIFNCLLWYISLQLFIISMIVIFLVTYHSPHQIPLHWLHSSSCYLSSDLLLCHHYPHFLPDRPLCHHYPHFHLHTFY